MWVSGAGEGVGGVVLGVFEGGVVVGAGCLGGAVWRVLGVRGWRRLEGGGG